MILRNEINEKVIITALNEIGWYETNVYEITETGLFWLDQKHSHDGASQAKARHEEAIAKEQPKEKHTCKYCDEIALNYWRLSDAWMCSRHFNIYVRERV